MNPTIILLIVLGFFALIVWVSVSKASEDGFYNSLCTALVVFCAFHFVNLQWRPLYRFLESELNLTGTHGVSTSYWLGFALIIVPGLIVSKLLSKPRVPFPKPLEQYGSIAVGAAIGLILFATVVQSMARFAFFGLLVGPLRPFRILFETLGARWVVF
jgi:hypothetical protein